MNRRIWTEQEIDALRRLYPDYSAEIVGKVLGRQPGSVHRKASELGLAKSHAFLQSARSGRIKRGKQHPAMVASQFKPGLRPWNKGTHYVAGGRSAETRFRKGNKPQTTLPLGSYRVNKDGNLQRKVAEVSGNNSKRWRCVAELVWIKAHGPLPPKHIVVFKPGMRTAVLEEITLVRVECISLAENARRNHPRNKHPEFARLVTLKGAITRQVNRIKKQAEELAQ